MASDPKAPAEAWSEAQKAVYDWIREDAPLVVQMRLEPSHVQALIWRIAALRASAGAGAVRVNLDAEVANLAGMAQASSVIKAKYLALGNEVAAAFWRGRARGLELAAHNLHVAPDLPLTSEEIRALPLTDGGGHGA